MSVQQKVIHDRLKHGQCIHCGIQTHQVVKKFGRRSEKIPMNIAGKVDHGRCLDVQCRDASIHMTMGPSWNDARRLNSTGAAISSMGIPIGGKVISYAETSLCNTTTTLSSTSSDSGYSSEHHPTLKQYQVNMSVLQQQQPSSSLEANQQILQGLPSTETTTTANQQSPTKPVQVGTMCPAHHQALQVWHDRERICDICQRLVPFGESAMHCSICEWDACSSCSQTKAQTVMITTKCPSDHQAPQIVTNHQCLCHVCHRLIPIGELSFHCSLCNGNACSLCHHTRAALKESKMTTTTTTMFCPSRHQARLMANNHRCICNVCHRTIPVGEMAFHCSTCDWDACSTCHHQYQETASQAEAITATCPSQHQVPLLVNRRPCMCDVCQRLIPVGEMAFHCSTCDWDACSGCSERSVPSADVRVTTICPANHETSNQRNDRLCLCDVCQRTIPRGESVLRCSICDWDFCIACHDTMTVDAKETPVMPMSCPLPQHQEVFVVPVLPHTTTDRNEQQEELHYKDQIRDVRNRRIRRSP